MYLALESLAAISAQKGEKEQSRNYLKQALKIAEDNFPKESEHITRIKKSLQELKI